RSPASSLSEAAAPPEIAPLSLHDALPIYRGWGPWRNPTCTAGNNGDFYPASFVYFQKRNTRIFGEPRDFLDGGQHEPGPFLHQEQAPAGSYPGNGEDQSPGSGAYRRCGRIYEEDRGISSETGRRPYQIGRAHV